MKRRKFIKNSLKGLTTIALANSLQLSKVFAVENKQRPNILVLIADDAGYKDFGCFGNPVIKTPNIDRLAEGGLKANNAFLTIPQCSPSRISILTGKYPHNTGAEDLHMPLPEDQLILPTYLKKGGYYTGLLKKSHLGKNGDNQFDFVSPTLDDFSKFIDSAKDSPFFLWVGFTEPHRPYNASEKIYNTNDVIVPEHLIDDLATREDLVDYYSEISKMDKKIGEYLNILKERNKLDNTLIIFFSDNGAPLPRAKGTLYDSGIKTPLIFYWNNVIKSGIKYDKLISVIDLAPTILDLANIPVPNNMVGKSFAGIISNPNLEGRKHVFSERNWHNCDEHMRSVRTEKYKLISNAYIELPHGTPADITASPTWKSLYDAKQKSKLTKQQSLIFQVPRDEYELYDLENDPEEYNNLIYDSNYKQIAEELKEVLENWKKETKDFSPNERRRKDNTDRYTGVKFDKTELPPWIN